MASWGRSLRASQEAAIPGEEASPKAPTFGAANRFLVR